MESSKEKRLIVIEKENEVGLIKTLTNAEHVCKPGSSLMGMKFDVIDIAFDPPTNRNKGWYEEYLPSRLEPGGKINYGVTIR